MKPSFLKDVFDVDVYVFSTSFIVTVLFDRVNFSLNISRNSSDNVKISDGSVIDRAVMCLKYQQTEAVDL